MKFKDYLNEKHGDYFNSQLEDEPIEIGDRVEVVGSGSGLKLGTKGTIADILNNGLYGIKLDVYVPQGHNLFNSKKSRQVKKGHGWYLYKKDFQVIGMNEGVGNIKSAHVEEEDNELNYYTIKKALSKIEGKYKIVLNYVLPGKEDEPDTNPNSFKYSLSKERKIYWYYIYIEDLTKKHLYYSLPTENTTKYEFNRNSQYYKTFYLSNSFINDLKDLGFEYLYKQDNNIIYIINKDLSKNKNYEGLFVKL